jgi:hypothetical protein
MTARFERLQLVDSILLIGLLSVVSIFLTPNSADAATANKTQLPLEIKNVQTIFPNGFMLPDANQISTYLYGSDEPQQKQVTEVNALQLNTVTPPAPAVAPVQKPAVTTSTTISYNLPPKATGDARVYMQEPEIRAYVCPKLGDDCNTFIAVLKAENGTHECTRDNRGTNRNGSVDVGLAQINWNPKYHPPYTFEQLQDCKFNLDIALQKYQARGFQPWAAYNSGAYKKHLPAVIAAANALAAEAVK